RHVHERAAFSADWVAPTDAQQCEPPPSRAHLPCKESLSDLRARRYSPSPVPRLRTLCLPDTMPGTSVDLLPSYGRLLRSPFDSDVGNHASLLLLTATRDGGPCIPEANRFPAPPLVQTGIRHLPVSDPQPGDRNS